MEKIADKIILRTAKVEDAERLVEIYSYYVTNTAVTFEWEVPSVQEFAQRIKDRQEKFPYIVAEYNGQLIGYAYSSLFRTRIAYSWCTETSIYLDKDFRRCGAGSILLAELEKQLKAQNYINVYACVTYIENEDEYLTHDSVEFHKKMGYTQVARFNKCGFKFNRWYDVVWLEKMLGDHNENPGFIQKPQNNL